MDAHLGMTLAGYQIESVIGRGGMGVVYLAEHLRLKRKVALKVLASELAEDERFRNRFMRESEIAASLDHPNVVTIHDAGEAGGLLYLAMRYIRGRDLKTLIEQEGPLPPDRVAALIGQAASALDAAHASGLIHRDVKSANILITPVSMGMDQAYLTDFGLTKRPESVSGITKTGQFMGSVDYAAPEQFEGRPLDARADVYSLGCVLYECLTGRVPFDRESEAAIMYAHLRDPPPKPSAARPELPLGFDSVVAKAMAKAPPERFATAGDLAQAAAHVLIPTGATAGGPAAGRRRVAIITGAAGALIAAVAAVLLLVTQGGPPDGGGPPAGPGGGATTRAVVRIDPTTNRVTARIPLEISYARPETVGRISAGEGAVWVSDGSSRLFKIRPETNTLVDTITVNGLFGGVVAAFGDVWAMRIGSPTTTATLARIDPTTNMIVGQAGTFPNTTFRLAAGEGAIWVLGPGGLYRAEPISGRIRLVADQGGQAIAVGDGAVWVLDVVRATLVKLDPDTGREMSKTPLQGSPTELAAGEGSVWVIDEGGSQVLKVPADGNGGIETSKVGPHPSAIAVGLGAVWVVNEGDSSVSRIDPITGTVTTNKVGGEIIELAVGEGAVWVA
jgi:DNA-binding beta-propeller fold protein YncE/predicted Ser/Thr protein kinase